LVPHNHDDLWSFVMLPDGKWSPPRFKFSRRVDVSTDSFRQYRVTVHATWSDPLTPRARSAARAAQWREQERAAHAKERRLWRQERREQYSEEYWLREQQGLSPPGTPEGSSLEEEEEERNGGRAPPERWNPPPPSPEAAEAAAESAPVAGADAPATRFSVEEPASAVDAPAGATATPPEPSRKRKRGFSNLR
jgi:hypothetical protein